MKIRGMNVWPQAIEQILLSTPGVSEFRGEAVRKEDGSDDLIIRIRPSEATEALDDITAALTDTIRKQTMVRPRIEIDRSIPDSDGDYKVRRWQDRRKEEAV